MTDAATPEVEVMPDLLPGTVVFESFRDGQVVEELAEAFRELSQLVLIHNGKGVLTLKLTLHPQANNMVTIVDEIDVKAPKAALPSSTRYIDKLGQPRQQNPNAPDLYAHLRALDPDNKETRTL